MGRKPPHSLSSMASGWPEVDTSRPFRSVKEAVAAFGDRLLSGELTPSLAKPPNPQLSASSSPSYTSPSSRFNHGGDEEELQIFSSLKRLEAELEKTRRELMLLKERGSETEITVASMNAELHRSRAKLAEMEAAKSGDGIREQLWSEERREDEEIFGSKIQNKTEITVEKKEYFLPSLATAIQLSEGDSDSIDGRRKTKMKKKNKKKKKKPIVPLIGHFFSKKKNSIELGEDSLYTKPYYSVVI